MEVLICKALLWKTGLSTKENYNQELDKQFSEKPLCDLLLELECCSSECEHTCDVLQRYLKYECKDFCVESFGKCLLENLKVIYSSDAFEIEDFGRMCYSLYQMLPDDLHTKEPFHVLSYADEPLSWGDEAQTRKLYEELFEFYE